MVYVRIMVVLCHEELSLWCFFLFLKALIIFFGLGFGISLKYKKVGYRNIVHYCCFFVVALILWLVSYGEEILFFKMSFKKSLTHLAKEALDFESIHQICVKCHHPQMVAYFVHKKYMRWLNKMTKDPNHRDISKYCTFHRNIKDNKRIVEP